jgi:hypothetical protein
MIDFSPELWNAKYLTDRLSLCGSIWVKKKSCHDLFCGEYVVTVMAKCLLQSNQCLLQVWDAKKIVSSLQPAKLWSCESKHYLCNQVSTVNRTKNLASGKFVLRSGLGPVRSGSGPVWIRSGLGRVRSGQQPEACADSQQQKWPIRRNLSDRDRRVQSIQKLLINSLASNSSLTFCVINLLQAEIIKTAMLLVLLKRLGPLIALASEIK